MSGYCVCIMVSPVAVVCVCVCLCACVERQNDLLSLDLMPVRQDCSGVSVLVCGSLQLGGHICIRLRCGVSV